jgi:hypothetical protein
MEAGGGDRSSSRSHVASKLSEPELLDSILVELREIERRSGIDRTLAIGELVLSRFFGGDARAWRDRRRNKNNSVRRLADREDCPFSKSALNESVAVYVASLSLPCVRTFGHIGASHVACVLNLTEEQRESVLRSAERDRVSVRELRKRVVALRRAEGERRGRRPDEAEERGLRSCRVGAVRLRQGLKELERVDAMSDLGRRRLAKLAAAVVQLSSGVAELCDKLGVASAPPPERKSDVRSA